VDLCGISPTRTCSSGENNARPTRVRGSLYFLTKKHWTPQTSIYDTNHHVVHAPQGQTLADTTKLRVDVHCGVSCENSPVFLEGGAGSTAVATYATSLKLDETKKNYEEAHVTVINAGQVSLDREPSLPPNIVFSLSTHHDRVLGRAVLERKLLLSQPFAGVLCKRGEANFRGLRA